MCVLVGDMISLPGVSPALYEASESSGPSRVPQAVARASTGRNRARPSHPSHSARSRASSAGRYGPRPGASESRDSVVRAAARRGVFHHHHPSLARIGPHRPVSGPGRAGWPTRTTTEGGWAGGRRIESAA